MESPAQEALAPSVPPPKVYYKAVKRAFAVDGTEELYSQHGDRTRWRIGETQAMDGEPLLCRRGFHACEYPRAPFMLRYGYDDRDVLLEVELGGKLVTDGIKTAGTTCTPLRIVSREELRALVSGVAVTLRTTNGSEEYHIKDGVYHRVGGPAFRADGMVVYYEEGFIHRANGPAMIYPDGTASWADRGMEIGMWKKLL